MAPGAKSVVVEEPEPARPPEPPAGGLDMPPAPPSLEVEAFPGQSKLREDERDRHLILHFSLPRTIMTYDMAKSRTTEVELNEVLSETAWGSLDRNTGEWVLASEEPSLEPPEPTLISYAEYVDRAFPSDTSLEEEERGLNAQEASQRRAAFTSQGEPGARLRPVFDNMVKSLTHTNKALAKAYDIKKPILSEDEVPEDPSRSEAQAIMRFGRHQVLPSFWHLLSNLTKRSRRFQVVFRSFSKEQLQAFQRELQLFCSGQHPAYCGQNKTQKPPPMNGEKGSRDLRLTDACIGRADRTGGRLEFPNLAVPDPTAPQPQAEDPAAAPATTTPPAAGAEGDAAAAPPPPTRPAVYEFPPFHEAYAGLQEHVLGGANTAAIVDDLEYWEANECQATAGKLLLVDHSGGMAETKVQHIFFDGAMGQSDARCVDVRDVVSGEPLPFSEVNDMFLHRVDLYQAATDMEYFIKALEACELKMSKKIVESRRFSQEAEQVDEPQEVPRLPHKEYLYRNVIPALLPALEACQRDRPSDPIEFIAFYMLRHPKQYSKTLKG